MTSPPSMRVVDYAKRWRADFTRLNLAWLEKDFVVEDIDRAVLLDPDTHLLALDGNILFAVGDDASLTRATSRYPGYVATA